MDKNELIKFKLIAILFVVLAFCMILYGIIDSNRVQEKSEISYFRGRTSIAPKFRIDEFVIVKETGKTGKVVNSQFLYESPDKDPKIKSAKYFILIENEIFICDEKELDYLNKG